MDDEEKTSAIGTQIANARQRNINRILPIIFAVIMIAPLFMLTACEKGYRVNFVENGGSAISDMNTKVIETEPITTKTDYIFLGWYSSWIFLGEKITFPYTPTGNITLHAKWQHIMEVKTYTHETLVDDLIAYSDWKQYIRYNDSIPSLLDNKLIELMEKNNFNAVNIYELFYLFPDSWDADHPLRAAKRYVVSRNQMYQPLALVAVLNNSILRNQFKTAVESCMKARLRDPDSLIIQGSQTLYMDYKYADEKYYVDSDGKYSITSSIYILVDYRAKNGFGGYNQGTIWLRWYWTWSYMSFSWTRYDSKYDLIWYSTDLYKNEVKSCGSISW
ncbi:MAG: InlB B-repeat-containing protein [Firmicutes bacterium]|nr:InlB B-repeat-containing protein [Bacillota bacterium]